MRRPKSSLHLNMSTRPQMPGVAEVARPSSSPAVALLPRSNVQYNFSENIFSSLRDDFIQKLQLTSIIQELALFPLHLLLVFCKHTAAIAYYPVHHSIDL